jgi:thymidylate synthase
MESKIKIHKIVARDLPDLWFQSINDLLEVGRRFIIDKGSYEGQIRLEYDYFIGHVLNPSYGSGTPEILPQIPSHLDIPNPVEFEYVYGGEGYDRSYIEYLMSDRKESGESYTYGERLTAARITNPNMMIVRRNDEIYNYHETDDENYRKATYTGEETPTARWASERTFLNQMEWVIDTYKKYGHRNNQMVLQIAKPTDLILKDPACLRSIDTRIQDGYLHFFIYFRSWDIFNGMPANLAGIEALHQYMASEIGVKQGEFIVESKGAHIYGYAEDLAKLRCLKE